MLPSKLTNSFNFAERGNISWTEITWVLHIYNKHISYNVCAKDDQIVQQCLPTVM